MSALVLWFVLGIGAGWLMHRTVQEHKAEEAQARVAAYLRQTRVVAIKRASPAQQVRARYN